jgi:hypothetical protein
VKALAVSRLFASLLFDVSPVDPISLGAACVVLVAAASAAAYLRRAMTADPVLALRSD